MKALSVKQPWANMLITGVKTMEIRTWKVKYRGRVYIQAGKTIDRNYELIDKDLRLKEFDLGMIIGYGYLVDIVELDLIQYTNAVDKHMIPWYCKGYGYPGSLSVSKKCYGWIFENVVEFEDPIPYMGKLGLFNITL